MTPAIVLLEKHQAPFRVHSYSHDPHTSSYGLEAAEKLGIAANRVFKTLIAITEKAELVVAIVPVESQLDLKALAKVCGAKKLEMAKPDLAQRTTGYLVGGISPLGQKKRLRTFIDESSKTHESIFVSAGRRGLEVELDANTLLTHTQGQLAPLAKG